MAMGRHRTICTRCSRPLSARTTASICSMCAWRMRKAKARNYVAELRTAPCRDCGVNKPGRMEFDHVPERGPKRFVISLAVARGYSMGRLQAEIDKCDLVCRECHHIRTANRGPYPGGCSMAGERNPFSKLTEAQVGEIRRCAAVGEPQTLLGRRFGVSQMQISRIVRRVDWANV